MSYFEMKYHIPGCSDAIVGANNHLLHISEAQVYKGKTHANGADAVRLFRLIWSNVKDIDAFAT